MQDILNSILEDLGKYKHTDRNALFISYINERLNKSFQTYYDELTKSINYLSRKNEIRVAKQLNRND